jgi:LEA14-like dessication related protein
LHCSAQISVPRARSVPGRYRQRGLVRLLIIADGSVSHAQYKIQPQRFPVNVLTPSAERRFPVDTLAMMPPMRLHRTALFLFAVALLFPGCASWFIKGEPPEVLVTNVTPLDATLFEQRLRVDLRVRNPNDFDYHVTGIDFTLNLNGKRLARGLGNKEVTIPRLGDAVMTIDTTTSTLDIVRQLLEFSQKQDLTYDIKGVLHSTDGRLPFTNVGTLVEPGMFSGSPAGSHATPQ